MCGSTLGGVWRPESPGVVAAALDAGVPSRDVQIAARHADPRTTAHHDRARNNLAHHASYIVTAFVAGAS
jgi:integrase/recombinase XerD